MCALHVGEYGISCTRGNLIRSAPNTCTIITFHTTHSSIAPAILNSRIQSHDSHLGKEPIVALLPCSAWEEQLHKTAHCVTFKNREKSQNRQKSGEATIYTNSTRTQVAFQFSKRSWSILSAKYWMQTVAPSLHFPRRWRCNHTTEASVRMCDTFNCVRAVPSLFDQNTTNFLPCIKKTMLVSSLSSDRISCTKKQFGVLHRRNGSVRRGNAMYTLTEFKSVVEADVSCSELSLTGP